MLVLSTDGLHLHSKKSSTNTMSLVSPLGATYGARLSAYLTTYDDFRKQRKRVNRNILRLRRDLGIVTRDTKNYRQNDKTAAISPAEFEADPRYGELLLLLAERDSLYASEIKSLLEMSNENRSAYRKLMVTKLKKALATSARLLDVTQNEKDALVRIELFVYAALTTGVYAINKTRWAEAIHAYSVARCGLELLAARAPDGASAETLMRDLLDAVVDPSLALAVSQHLGAESAPDVRTVARAHCRDGTVARLGPAVAAIEAVDASFVAQTPPEEVVRSVQWRHHDARIYNDEVAARVGRASRADWRSFNANDYDALYAQWSALVDTHHDDVTRNTDADDAERVQDGAVLMTYLRYHMLLTRAKRDLVLIGELEGDEKDKEAENDQGGESRAAPASFSMRSRRDIVRLYGAVAAAVDELKDLPGVHNDDDLAASLDNMARYFTARRAAVIADAYASVGRFDAALKIYAHVERTLPSDGAFYTVEFPYDVATNEQADELAKSVAARRTRAHAMAQLCHKSSAQDVAADDVHSFGVGHRGLTRLTERATIEPVLSKAVLFDVAYNYISYAAGERATSERATSDRAVDEDDKKKGGFFGIFGR